MGVNVQLYIIFDDKCHLHSEYKLQDQYLFKLSTGHVKVRIACSYLYASCVFDQKLNLLGL